MPSQVEEHTKEERTLKFPLSTEADEILARHSKLRQQYIGIVKEGGEKAPTDRLSFLGSMMTAHEPNLDASTASKILGVFNIISS